MCLATPAQYLELTIAPFLVSPVGSLGSLVLDDNNRVMDRHQIEHVSIWLWLQLMLSSDEGSFGGFENLSKKYDTEFASTAADYDGRPHSIQVRCCCVHPIFCRSCSLLLWMQQ